MSKRQDIQTRIWSDSKFRQLSPTARYLYIWTFTNSDCNPAGLYQIGDEAIMQDTGLTPTELAAAKEELAASRHVIFEGEYVWVRARVANWRSRNDLTAKSIANTVGQLDHKHPLRVAFLFEYEDTAWLADHLEPLILQERVDPEFGAACDLLSATLAAGPLPAREVKTAAHQAGIKQSVLLKAKAELQVDNGPDGTWLLQQRTSDLALQATSRIPLNGTYPSVPLEVLKEGQGQGEGLGSSTSQGITATSKPSSLDEKFSVHSARKNSSVKTEKARQIALAPTRAAEARRVIDEWVRSIVPEVAPTDPRVATWVEYQLKHTETGREVMNNRSWFRAQVAHTFPEYAELIRRNDEGNNHAA